jgi:hypothetical protein
MSSASAADFDFISDDVPDMISSDDFPTPPEPQPHPTPTPNLDPNTDPQAEGQPQAQPQPHTNPNSNPNSNDNPTHNLNLDASTPRLLSVMTDTDAMFKLLTDDKAASADCFHNILVEMQTFIDMPEIGRDLRERLRNASNDEISSLLTSWRTLNCRNGLFVEFNSIRTAHVRCNQAPLMLGTGHAAKAAVHYAAKYMIKEAHQLVHALAYVIDARKHVDTFPSTAADTGTSQRTAIHMLQRILNSQNVELAPTEAATIALNIASSSYSHSFAYAYVWDAVAAMKLLPTGRKFLKDMPDESEADDEDIELTADERDGDVRGSDVERDGDVDGTDVAHIMATALAGASSETSARTSSVYVDAVRGLAGGDDDERQDEQDHDPRDYTGGDHSDGQKGRTGTCGVYAGPDTKPVAVSQAEFFGYRDPKLWHLNFDEFVTNMQVLQNVT